MKERVLLFLRQLGYDRGELYYRKVLDVPPVGFCDHRKFGSRFGKSDIKALLSLIKSFQKELEG